MKKIVCFTTIFLISIVLSGCGGKKSVTKIQDKDLANEYANAPQWVLGAAMDQGMASVGSAKKSKAGVAGK